MKLCTRPLWPLFILFLSLSANAEDAGSKHAESTETEIDISYPRPVMIPGTQMKCSPSPKKSGVDYVQKESLNCDDLYEQTCKRNFDFENELDPKTETLNQVEAQDASEEIFDKVYKQIEVLLRNALKKKDSALEKLARETFKEDLALCANETDKAKCEFDGMVLGLSETIGEHLSRPLEEFLKLDDPLSKNADFKKIQTASLDIMKKAAAPSTKDRAQARSIFSRLQILSRNLVLKLPQISQNKRQELALKLGQITFSDDPYYHPKMNPFAVYLGKGAHFTPKTKNLNFHPGRYLSERNIFSQIFVMAHEMGHSIDPCNIQEKNASAPLADFYNPRLMQCLGDARSIGFGGIEKNRLCTRYGESFADWFATEITVQYMNSYLKDMSPQKKRAGIVNALRGFCAGNGDRSGEVAPLEKDDPHLFSKERINKALGAHPAIREALGCSKAFAPNTIYCQQDGSCLE